MAIYCLDAKSLAWHTRGPPHSGTKALQSQIDPLLTNSPVLGLSEAQLTQSGSQLSFQLGNNVFDNCDLKALYLTSVFLETSVLVCNFLSFSPFVFCSFFFLV